ncbi:MAG: 1-(5-phosphoribosyl)-5-[(5-phosphoribosylamino)methylideneamino]imidazole-4-carboxamide isomerase [Eubacteriales bacterium]
MYIFPAIDLFGGRAVRLYKGDYSKMTFYSDDPVSVALDFARAGADHLHLVDLEGAKTGLTPNLDVVKRIIESGRMFTEIGGGVRNMETVEKYLSIGADRVILGTAAVDDEDFLRCAVTEYGEKIAVGVDIKDGYVAVRGWTEKSSYSCFDFCQKMQDIGVKALICTDISKDGAMRGTNRELYKELSERFSVKITASGGVSSIDDVKALAEMGIYGAVIGKAYYTGAIDLHKAVEVAK